MAHRLGGFVAFADDLGQVPSTHPHGGSQPSLSPTPGDLIYLLTSTDTRCMHNMHTCRYVVKIYHVTNIPQDGTWDMIGRALAS